MDAVLQIIQAFLSSVPNASLLLLFPIAAVIMGGVSMGVTAVGESLDVREELMRRQKRSEWYVQDQLAREAEAELKKLKLLE